MPKSTSSSKTIRHGSEPGGTNGIAKPAEFIRQTAFPTEPRVFPSCGRTGGPVHVVDREPPSTSTAAQRHAMESTPQISHRSHWDSQRSHPSASRGAAEPGPSFPVALSLGRRFYFPSDAHVSYGGFGHSGRIPRPICGPYPLRLGQGVQGSPISACCAQNPQQQADSQSSGSPVYQR